MFLGLSIVLLKLSGYQMIITNLVLRASLVIYHLVSSTASQIDINSIKTMFL